MQVEPDRLVYSLCSVMSSFVTHSEVSCDSKGGRLEGACILVHAISMSDNECVRLGYSDPAISLESKLKSRYEVK